MLAQSIVLPETPPIVVEIESKIEAVICWWTSRYNYCNHYTLWDEPDLSGPETSARDIYAFRPIVNNFLKIWKHVETLPASSPYSSTPRSWTPRSSWPWSLSAWQRRHWPATSGRRQCHPWPRQAGGSVGRIWIVFRCSSPIWLVNRLSGKVKIIYIHLWKE